MLFPRSLRYLLSAMPLVVLSVPAVADGGSAVPEPSSTLLLGLGVLGLIIGRRGARKRRDDD